MHTIRDILDRWPSRQALADDTGAGLAAVHHWYSRGRVPAKYDGALLVSAARREIPLDAMELVKMRSFDAFAPEGSCLSGEDNGADPEIQRVQNGNNPPEAAE